MKKTKLSVKLIDGTTINGTIKLDDIKAFNEDLASDKKWVMLHGTPNSVNIQKDKIIFVQIGE